MNSGENFLLAASTAVLSTFSSRSAAGLSFGWMNPIPPVISSVISPPPRFDVMKITVCDKSTRRLSPNVKVAFIQHPQQQLPKCIRSFLNLIKKQKLSFSLSV